MSQKISWHRYVPFESIPAYQALGWELDYIVHRAKPMGDGWTQLKWSSLHAPHGAYSVLMTWAAGGEPIEPVGVDA